MSGHWTHIVVKQHFPETDEIVVQKCTVCGRERYDH
jgi:hypothetical protein